MLKWTQLDSALKKVMYRVKHVHLFQTEHST